MSLATCKVPLGLPTSLRFLCLLALCFSPTVQLWYSVQSSSAHSAVVWSNNDGALRIDLEQLRPAIVEDMLHSEPFTKCRMTGTALPKPTHHT